MFRSYQAIYRTKNGNLRRFVKPEWGVNVWGNIFWGHVWAYLGLKYEGGFRLIWFPHVIVKKDFERAKELLSTVTDETLCKAVVYGFDQMEYTEGINLLDDYIKQIREEIIPLFQKPNAIGIVSDYVENMKELKEELAQEE